MLKHVDSARIEKINKSHKFLLFFFNQTVSSGADPGFLKAGDQTVQWQLAK